MKKILQYQGSASCTTVQQTISKQNIRYGIPFFSHDVKVKRIESQHDPDNPNSGKVMEMCGFLFEGILRKADRNNKGIADACMYGLLAED